MTFVDCANLVFARALGCSRDPKSKETKGTPHSPRVVIPESLHFQLRPLGICEFPSFEGSMSERPLFSAFFRVRLALCLLSPNHLLAKWLSSPPALDLLVS